jgi:hypothetical protein
MPLGKPGRPPALKETHMDYIETRTLQDRKLFCKAPAAEMVELLPDLDHLSPTTVQLARRKLEYLYRPIRWEAKLTGAVKRDPGDGANVTAHSEGLAALQPRLEHNRESVGGYEAPSREREPIIARRTRWNHPECLERPW